MPDDLPSYWGKPAPSAFALGRKVGLTDQYLRVWRLILFQAQGKAVSLGWDVPGQGPVPLQIQAGRAAPTVVEQAPYAVISSDDVFTSEVPTGQYPGQETYAAGLRIHFTVTLGTSQTANTAEITIYNLAKDTVSSLIKEYNYCILQAGYEYGQAGSIFAGTIKMYKTGHEANIVDSYVKLYAADGDMGICNGLVNHTYPPGTDPQTQVEDFQKAMQQQGDVYPGTIERAAIIVPPNSRSEVRYGMAADHCRDFAQSNQALWHVLNGKFNWAKPTSYQEGAAVNLTAATGLIGFPEVTQDGINVTALINPAIKLNQLIRLDNAYINQYWTPGGQSGASYQYQGAAAMQYFFPVQADGLYVPVSINYEGDSRGQPWYQYMVCRSVDSTMSRLAAFFVGFDWSQI